LKIILRGFIFCDDLDDEDAALLFLDIQFADSESFG